MRKISEEKEEDKKEEVEDTFLIDFELKNLYTSNVEISRSMPDSSKHPFWIFKDNPNESLENILKDDPAKKDAVSKFLELKLWGEQVSDKEFAKDTNSILNKVLKHYFLPIQIAENFQRKIQSKTEYSPMLDDVVGILGNDFDLLKCEITHIRYNSSEIVMGTPPKRKIEILKRHSIGKGAFSEEFVKDARKALKHMLDYIINVPKGYPLICLDATKDPFPKLVKKIGAKQHASFPIPVQDEIFGYLHIIKGKNNKPFTENGLRAINYICKRIGKTIEDAKRIEEEKKDKEKIRTLSLRDRLTGAYNGRFLYETLDRLIKKKRRIGTNFSYIRMDIDYFKIYNDTYGHPEGDKTIKYTCNFFRDKIRATDIFCRPQEGGDELDIIFPETDLETTFKIMDRLYKNFREINRNLNDYKKTLTLSMGAGSSSQIEDLTDPKQIIKLVDKALYVAKGLGRNTLYCALKQKKYRKLRERSA